MAKALSLIKENKISWVDVQFTDLVGRLHHITLPARDFDEDSFTNGFGKLDGSSIRGFTPINESDMLLVPVPESLAVIPWMPNTARVLTKVMWGGGKGRFERDPRGVAERAEKYQAENGYSSFYGPEPEFFIFDKVELDVSTPQSGTSYRISSRESPWNKEGGFFVRYKEGYYPGAACRPADGYKAGSRGRPY